MMWLSTVLAAVGSSVVTCVFMEAYFQRKAQNEAGVFDSAPESEHRH
jgi:hypothetical protein